MNTIKVSVLIPIYNAAATLQRALDSLKVQAIDGCPEALEFVCVNDGSKDNSLEIMKAYAAEDPRFVVLDKPNGGYGQGLNRALEIAHGEYVAILEPDDFIEGPMFEVLYHRAHGFSQPEAVDIVKSSYWRETTYGATTYGGFRHRIKDLSGVFTVYEDAGILSDHPTIWTCIYRLAFLNGKNSAGESYPPIRFPEIPGAGWADNPFLIETVCRAGSISYVDQCFYHYFEDGPESSSGKLKNVHLPFDRWEDMDDILKSLGVTNEGVLDQHYSRAFNYLRHVRERCDLSDPVNEKEFGQRCQQMFSRMDKDLVLKSSLISKGNKEFFLETLGLPLEPIKNGAYRRGYYKMLFNSLQESGVKVTCMRFKTFVRRRRQKI